MDRLFEAMLAHRASDLHLLEGQPPKLRQHGRVVPIPGEPVLSGEALGALLKELASPELWSRFLDTGDLDFAYAMGEHARFRANYYRQVHGLGAVFRVVPTRIRTLEELNMPAVLRSFAELRGGLALVTGPTGSGKSTTLAAIIDHINTNQARYILTIEEPIEFVHPNKRSYFCQREVGVDVKTFAEGLRIACRQDCDVILVGEMRDFETISLALRAASMGTLVFGTMHTNSAGKTIDRIIDVFPVDQQPQARSMLADCLAGICAQLLLRTADGEGRMACNEILLADGGLASSIREGNVANIRNVIQSGRSRGMQLMDDAIAAAVTAGIVSGEEAYMKAQDKSRFAQHAPAGPAHDR